MIRVSRLNGSELVINADLIETLEATPDTVVTLTTLHKYVVSESVDEVMDRVLAYKQQIFMGPRSRGS